MKFLRRNWNHKSKLGRKRKKKQVWRKPKGRHNKMREKIRGHSASVDVGYKKSKKARNKISGKKLIIIMNIMDLEKIKKDEIGIVGSVGRKKKVEIAAKAKEKKIILRNMNAEKFLEENKKTREEKNES